MELREKYPKAIFRLFTNRLRKEIWYPDVYSFEEYVGKDDMELYILDNINKVPWLKLLIPLNLYIYLTGLFLFKRNQTPKVLYLFFKHIVKGERVYVEDDDRRVTLTFRW